MPKFRTRRVNTAEDRNRGRGKFITLKKTGDQFLGYALFVADPELDDNPGYYEYFEHFTPATGYCPCAESDDQECPLCAEGDNPSTRAKSMWLVIENENDDPDSGEVRIFNMNYSTVQDFVEDGEEARGQLYRVKRQEGNGVYSVRPKSKKLTKTELKAAMKEIEEDQLEKIAQRQLNRVLEEMDVAAAMEDDDDDDDDDEPKQAQKARKGKEKEAEPEDDDDNDEPAGAFDPDEDDKFDGNVTVVKTNKRNNTATVTDENDTEFTLYGTDDIDVREAGKGEIFTASAGKDEDGDFVLDMWVEGSGNGDDPGAGGSDVDSVEDEKVTVVKVNPSPEDTLVVEMEDGTEFELYFPGRGEDADGKDWEDFDIDDYSVGDVITVSAAKDDDGDMLAASFPAKSKAKGKGKEKAKSGSKRK